MSGKQFSLDSHLDLVQGMESGITGRPTSEPAAAPVLLEDSSEYEQNKSGKGAFVILVALIAFGRYFLLSITIH